MWSWVMVLVFLKSRLNRSEPLSTIEVGYSFKTKSFENLVRSTLHSWREHSLVESLLIEVMVV